MKTRFIVEPWRQGWRVRAIARSVPCGIPTIGAELSSNIDARILAAALNTISEEQWLRIVKSELRAA